MSKNVDITQEATELKKQKLRMPNRNLFADMDKQLFIQL